jgi:hypothetical protein
VLTTDGEVVGVIFGRADSEEDLAYAVTTAELLPVVAQATELDTAVEPGRCAA